MYLSNFLENPGVAIILLIVLFAIIGLIAFLIKNFLPSFKNKDEIVEDEETIVRKEIERKIVILDQEKTFEDAQEKPKETTPDDHKADEK